MSIKITKVKNMKAFHLRVGNLYRNHYNSDLMLYLGSETDISGYACWFKFLIGTEIREFNWSQFHTIPLEELE